jgi:hypothetical protein
MHGKGPAPVESALEPKRECRVEGGFWGSARMRGREERHERSADGTVTAGGRAEWGQRGREGDPRAREEGGWRVRVYPSDRADVGI